MSAEGFCGRYAEYVLIIGIFLVAVGLIVASQGSPQPKEGSVEDFQGGTTHYTYEVPGQKHVMGMNIMLVGALMNGVGGAMGWWFLRDLKEDDEISSNFRWFSLSSLLFGLFIACLGFYWAITNDMQTVSSGGVPIMEASHFAVKQILGMIFLASGIMMSVSGGVLVGMVMSKTETGSVLPGQDEREEDIGQRTLWEESDEYGERTTSYKRVAQIGLLMMGVGTALMFSLFALNDLNSDLSIISMMLFFLGLFVAVPGAWGYFEEKRMEGKDRVGTKEGMASLMLLLLGMLLLSNMFPLFLLLNSIAIVLGYMGIRKGDNTIAIAGLGGGVIMYVVFGLLVIFLGLPAG